MNDFTKKELEHILYCVSIEPLDDLTLVNKIKSMVENYCEPVCPECFDKECFKSHKCIRKLNDNQ